MKKLIILLSFLVVVAMNGCATNPELIRSASIGTRSDVFQELTDGGPISQGYADLRIVSSLKTHRPGIYSARDIHGTPEYRLLLNIDGQATRIRGDLQEENTVSRGIRDPEAGEGIRYRFNKNLRLKAGTHKIVIAIIEDEIAVEREITLTGGSSNRLELEPIYRSAPGERRPAIYGVTSFMEGLRGLRYILNGKPM